MGIRHLEALAALMLLDSTEEDDVARAGRGGGGGGGEGGMRIGMENRGLSARCRCNLPLAAFQSECFRGATLYESSNVGAHVVNGRRIGLLPLRS